MGCDYRQEYVTLSIATLKPTLQLKRSVSVTLEHSSTRKSVQKLNQQSGSLCPTWQITAENYTWGFTQTFSGPLWTPMSELQQTLCTSLGLKKYRVILLVPVGTGMHEETLSIVAPS